MHTAVGLFDLLLEHLLGLVDLCSEVGAAAAIGVVEQHEGAVLLAQQLFCDAALAGEG